MAPGGARGWALLGCTLVPPWDQAGFALAERNLLLGEFPEAGVLIHALTR